MFYCVMDYVVRYVLVFCAIICVYSVLCFVLYLLFCCNTTCCAMLYDLLCNMICRKLYCLGLYVLQYVALFCSVRCGVLNFLLCWILQCVLTFCCVVFCCRITLPCFRYHKTYWHTSCMHEFGLTLIGAPGLNFPCGNCKFAIFNVQGFYFIFRMLFWSWIGLFAFESFECLIFRNVLFVLVLYILL